jgi:hypothetical protein
MGRWVVVDQISLRARMQEGYPDWGVRIAEQTARSHGRAALGDPIMCSGAWCVVVVLAVAPRSASACPAPAAAAAVGTQLGTAGLGTEGEGHLGSS